MPRPVDLRITVRGLRDMEESILRFGPGFAAALVGPALGAAAREARVVAKKRDFVFTDRRARRRRGPGGRFTSLRQSIRSHRTTGIYGGVKYKRGRALLRAGGDGARQAYLVEAGHLGPRPARPYPFIKKAQRASEAAQEKSFYATLGRLYPLLVRKYISRSGRGEVGAAEAIQRAHSRTVARRARRKL